MISQKSESEIVTSLSIFLDAVLLFFSLGSLMLPDFGTLEAIFFAVVTFFPGVSFFEGTTFLADAVFLAEVGAFLTILIGRLILSSSSSSLSDSTGEDSPAK